MELFRFSQRQFLKSSGSKKIPFLYLSCLQSLFLLPRVPEVCGHLYLILSKQENRTNSMNWDQPYNSKLLSSADQLVIWCVISCRAFFFFFPRSSSWSEMFRLIRLLSKIHAGLRRRFWLDWALHTVHENQEKQWLICTEQIKHFLILFCCCCWGGGLAAHPAKHSNLPTKITEEHQKPRGAGGKGRRDVSSRNLSLQDFRDYFFFLQLTMEVTGQFLACKLEH